jgi:hypothetical protein
VLYRLGNQAACAWLEDALVGVALINPTPEGLSRGGLESC